MSIKMKSKSKNNLLETVLRRQCAMLSAQDILRDFKKKEAFNQIEFLIDRGFEAPLLAKNLGEYMSLVQSTVTHVENTLNIIGTYILFIDKLERETSEKRLNYIQIQLTNLDKDDFGDINEDANQKLEKHKEKIRDVIELLKNLRGDLSAISPPTSLPSSTHSQDSLAQDNNQNQQNQ